LTSSEPYEPFCYLSKSFLPAKILNLFANIALYPPNNDCFCSLLLFPKREGFSLFPKRDGLSLFEFPNNGFV
jgi:hypothetical protein